VRLRVAFGAIECRVVPPEDESLPPGVSKQRDKGRALSGRLLEAVGKALAGDWPAAHVIVQAHEEDALAAWIHAVVHRMEGDLGNAGYWYRRCGRTLREDVPTDVELREIRAALRAGPEAT
jgi:hypothetical protein